MREAVSGFSIPRVAIAATLRLTEGAARRGKIFLMERVPHHTGPETPLEMLNRPEAFYPFRPDEPSGGAVLLVTKAHTIIVAVTHEAAGEDPARLSAAKRVALELTLDDGTNLIGWAAIEMPVHHSRLLDYLNSSTDPFVAVAAGNEVYFVNRAHVRYARPQE